MFKKSYAISKISFLENNKKTLVLNSNSARGDELLTGLKAHQGLLLRLFAIRANATDEKGLRSIVFQK